MKLQANLVCKLQVYLKFVGSEAVGCINAADDMKPLAFLCIDQIKGGSRRDSVYIPDLQSPLHQFIFVYIPHSCFPCNQEYIISVYL